MYQRPPIDIPHGDEVSTEPQRQALEAMSNDLVAKLNAMVAEQEQRAHEFALQQHSLSSLPTQTLPEISAPALPEITSVPTIQPREPSVQQQAQGVYGRMYRQEAPTITNGPALPQVPRAVSQPRFQQRSAQQHTHNSSRDYRMPTVIRDTDSDKKEGGLSASTVAIIIFVLFVFILHGCD